MIRGIVSYSYYNLALKRLFLAVTQSVHPLRAVQQGSDHCSLRGPCDPDMEIRGRCSVRPAQRIHPGLLITFLSRVGVPPAMEVASLSRGIL